MGKYILILLLLVISSTVYADVMMGNNINDKKDTIILGKMLSICYLDKNQSGIIYATQFCYQNGTCLNNSGGSISNYTTNANYSNYSNSSAFWDNLDSPANIQTSQLNNDAGYTTNASALAYVNASGNIINWNASGFIVNQSQNLSGYAQYQFGNNKFNGSGNFTTTGLIHIGGDMTQFQTYPLTIYGSNAGIIMNRTGAGSFIYLASNTAGAGGQLRARAGQGLEIVSLSGTTTFASINGSGINTSNLNSTNITANNIAIGTPISAYSLDIDSASPLRLSRTGVGSMLLSFPSPPTTSLWTSSVSMAFSVFNDNAANAAIFINSSNRVGINMTNPTVALDVGGGIKTSAAITATGNIYTSASYGTGGGSVTYFGATSSSNDTVNGSLIVTDATGAFVKQATFGALKIGSNSSNLSAPAAMIYRNGSAMFNDTVRVRDITYLNGSAIGGGGEGITNSTSYWLCTSANCSSTCQVTITKGLITGCS